MSRSAFCFLRLLLASSSGRVRAQTAPEIDREQASVHFDRGLELIEDAAYAQAAVEFERAYELSQNDAVLYNLGMAYVAAGRSVEAAESLSLYLDRTRQAQPQAEIDRIEAELRRQRLRIGYLTLHVEPPTALVKLDGRELGSSSPWSVPLSVGDHRIDASLAGYESANRSVTVAGEQQVSLHIALRRLDANPAAQLPIRCEVPDVTVLVDDQVVPQTMSSAPVLTTSGEHVVLFRRAGYDEQMLPIVLGAGMAEPVECTLRILAPLPPTLAAKLSVRVSEPRADVLLDGQTLPHDGSVPIGRHRLTVAARGFEPWSREIDLTAGEARAIKVRLTPASEVRDARAESAQTQRTMAYVLGAVGVVAGVAAVSVYLVADAQYDDWETEDLELTVLGEAVNRNPLDTQLAIELMNRTNTNNELLKSVWQLDTVSMALAIGGSALFAAGAVVLFTAGDPERPQAPSAQLQLRGPGLQLRARFGGL